MKGAKRVNPKSSHHEENIFFSISLMLYLYEMIDVRSTYCGNHFMMYVSQITVNDVCQLYLNKTGGKKDIYIYTGSASSLSGSSQSSKLGYIAHW